MFKRSLLLLTLAAAAVVSQAADYSVYFQQKLPGGVPGFRSIIIDEPTSNAFYIYNLANHQPEQFTFDSTIVCNTTTHICSVPTTVGPAGPSGIDGATGSQGPKGDTGPAPDTSAFVTTPSLVTTLSSYVSTMAFNAGLNTKYSIPTGTTAQYIRGDGSLATLPTAPTVPVINRAVITTATNGTYTWTLPTACATGQLPVVSLTPEDSSTTAVINPKVTAKTNTTVSISAMRTETNTVALLGLTILSVPGTAVASTIHAVAICP